MVLDIVFQSVQEQINQGSTPNSLVQWIPLLTAFAGLGTFYIAYKIFRNQDAKKYFVKIQVETVLKLASSLEDSLLMFYVQLNQPELTTSSFSFHVSSIKTILERRNHQLFESRKLYVSSMFFELDFLSYTNHLFLPKEIKKELLKFYSGARTNSTKEQIGADIGSTNVSAIDKRKLEGEQNPNLEPTFTLFTENDIYRTPETFIRAIISFKKSLIDWLKDYGIEPNIEST